MTKGGKQVIKNMSFELGPSSPTAVIGPSAAGKSTLLGALTGCSPATHGQVIWRGADLYSHYEQLRFQAGLVPQSDIQHPQLSVRQGRSYAAMLRLPPDATAAEWSQCIQHVVAPMRRPATALPRRTHFGPRPRAGALWLPGLPAGLRQPLPRHAAPDAAGLGGLSRVVPGDDGPSLRLTANDEGVKDHQEALTRLTILIMAAALMGTAVTVRELGGSPSESMRSGSLPGSTCSARSPSPGTGCFGQGMLVTWPPLSGWHATVPPRATSGTGIVWNYR